MLRSIVTMEMGVCVYTTKISWSDVLDNTVSTKNLIILFPRSRGIVFIHTNNEPPYAMG